MSAKTKERLEQALARLETLRRAGRGHRGALVDRAREQLRTSEEPVKAWAKETEDQGGAVHPLRRYKTLLRERQRLQAVIGDHEDVLAAEHAPEPF